MGIWTFCLKKAWHWQGNPKGGVEIKNKKKQANKQKQQNKDKQTKELDRGLIKCSQGMPHKNSVEVR